VPTVAVRYIKIMAARLLLIHGKGPTDAQLPFIKYHAETLEPFLRAKLAGRLDLFLTE